jgi:Fe-S-cluster-containing dehydrogenase component
MRYVVTHCMHCSQPRCMDACPVGAISKREDGIVLVSQELCTGCKECIDACPLGVMQFNEEKEVAQKCDLCVDLIDRGLKPACVNACPGYCIYFGDVNEVTERLGKQKLLVWYKGITV